MRAGGTLDAVCVSCATALSKACARGNTDKARELVRRGAALDGQNCEGRTALMKAAANGDFATARVLLEAGVDPKVVIRCEHDPDPQQSFAGFTAAEDALMHAGADAAEMEALLVRAGAKKADRKHPMVKHQRRAMAMQQQQ